MAIDREYSDPNRPKPERENPASSQFPQGFVWGTATAAYQIEGACG